MGTLLSAGRGRSGAVACGRPGFSRSWWAALLVLCLGVFPAHAELMQEAFDTNAVLNPVLYDTSLGLSAVHNGSLTLWYPSYQYAYASGLECRLPASPVAPSAREFDIQFSDGGSEMSTSMFIAYSLAPGRGLAIPPMPAGNRFTDRSGYILRLIHHGDGTNEVKSYRIDSGLTNEVASWPVHANPVTALRRVRILHHRSGRHAVEMTLDTGVRTTSRFGFEDDRYPPGNDARGMQVSVKGHHTAIKAVLNIVMDSWAVRDRIDPVDRGVDESRRHRAVDSRARSDMASAVDTRAVLTDVRAMFERGDILDAETACMRILRRDSENPDLLDLMAGIDMARLRWSDADWHLRRAMDLRQRTLGDTYPSMAADLSRLADIRMPRDTAESERLYRRALVVQQTRFGKRSMEAAAALFDLAELYRKTSMDDAAAPVYRQAMDVLKGCRGDTSSLAASVLSRWGIMELTRNRFEDAERLLVPALECMKPGPMRTDILRYLGEVYQSLGKLEKALETLTGLTKNMEQTLGPDHPDLGDMAYKIGLVCERLGRPADARSCFARALTVKEKALRTRNHPEIAFILRHLAAVHIRLGQVDEAEKMLREALTILDDVLGRMSTQKLTTLNDLSFLLVDQKRYAEAQEPLEEMLRIKGNEMDRDHPDLAGLRNMLARVYYEQGMTAEAETMIRETLASQQAKFGPEHAVQAPTLINLAMMYYTMRRYDESEPVLLRALSVTEKTYGTKSSFVSYILENLATVYQGAGRLAEAERCQKKVVRIRETFPANERHATAEAWELLSEIESQMGKTAEAASSARRAAENRRTAAKTK